jgi:hypothetical protein
MRAVRRGESWEVSEIRTERGEEEDVQQTRRAPVSIGGKRSMCAFVFLFVFVIVIEVSK